MTGIGNPDKLDASGNSREDPGELLVADGVLILPVEVNRTDHLVETVDFALRIARGHLCTVTAVVKDHAVTCLQAGE